MDAIKGWAIGICMASLAGTIVHFLSPSGNTQRMFKVVLSVFFITVLIYPLGLFNGDIDDVVQGYTYPDSYVDNAEQIGDIVLQQSINQLELAIGDEVRKFDIDEYEILIKTDIDEEERIVISSIDVVIGKGYADKKQELYTKLKESVDCQVNVYVGG
ncbi:MAG: stage III sporulation protein AF [Clostridia bacterium]|nr:stage III sporulation protein AF [Clostridia bacterium]